MSGPLEGVKVVELAGIGPAPYACMLLADAGAQVLRLARPSDEEISEGRAHWNLLARSRPSIGIDLKHPDAVQLVLDLATRADVLIEGFRPGVAERLGVGPESCLERNRALVYGRITGWGQEGPLSQRAGHDINYIALSGALWPIGRKEGPPTPPLNLVGDFGGGGMLLAFGVLAALVDARGSGSGQVVDAAMTDGSASLMTMVYSFMQAGRWTPERGVNLLDTGAPFYDVYQTADGEYFSVGAIEPKFYARLLETLGLTAENLPDQMDEKRWPELRERFGAVFLTRTRDEWESVFSDVDACAYPVLSPWEAAAHPHNQSRKTFVSIDGVVQPAPAPRFSRTPAVISSPPLPPSSKALPALEAWGIDPTSIEALNAAGAIF